MGTRARAAQSALYYERLLEMKDEQLAMRTRLSAAASAPKPEPSQRALEQLVQKLTAERDAWRGRCERPGGQARELERLRRENRTQALWLEAHLRALMQAASLTRSQAEEAVREQAGKLASGSDRLLLERTANSTRGAPRPLSSSASVARVPSSATKRPATAPKPTATADAAARAAAESEAAALRAALSQEARRREELVEAYNGALVAQHERAAACADCDVDRREWQIERQLRREECEQLRADLAESAAEGAALRREVRALQEKLLALFSAQMSADGQ